MNTIFRVIICGAIILFSVIVVWNFLHICSNTDTSWIEYTIFMNDSTDLNDCADPNVNDPAKMLFFVTTMFHNIFKVNHILTTYD